MLHFNGDALLSKERPTRKPDTFVFLGFTHFLAKARSGILTVMLKPSVKARERFISNVRTWLKLNRHLPVRDQRAHLDKMLNGFYQYFGLRLCCTPLYGVRQPVRRAKTCTPGSDRGAGGRPPVPTVAVLLNQA